jgi:hypothetical protein
VCEPAFSFSWGNYAKKRNYKINRNLCFLSFGGLESPKVRIKKKNRQIPVFSFQCVTKDIEG